MYVKGLTFDQFPYNASQVDRNCLANSWELESGPVAPLDLSKNVNLRSPTGSSFSTFTAQSTASEARHTSREVALSNSLRDDGNDQCGNSPSRTAPNACSPSPRCSKRDTNASPERKCQSWEEFQSDSTTVNGENTPLKASQHPSPVTKSWSHVRGNVPIVKTSKSDGEELLIDLENDGDGQLTPKSSGVLEQLNPNNINAAVRSLPSHLPRPTKSWVNRPGSSHSATTKENPITSSPKGFDELQTQSKCEFEVDDFSDPEANIVNNKLCISCPKTVAQELFYFTFGFSLHLLLDEDGGAHQITIPPMELATVGVIEAKLFLETDWKRTEIPSHDSLLKDSQDLDYRPILFDISKGFTIPLPTSPQGGIPERLLLNEQEESSNAETFDSQSRSQGPEHTAETVLADTITHSPTSPVKQDQTPGHIIDVLNGAKDHDAEISQDNNIFGISVPGDTYTEDQNQCYQPTVDEKEIEEEDEDWENSEMSDYDMSIKHGVFPPGKLISLMENATRDLKYEWKVSFCVKRVRRTWVLTYTAYCLLYWPNLWPEGKEETVRMLIVYGPGGQHSHSVKEEGSHIIIEPAGDSSDDQAPTVIQIHQLTPDCNALTVTWRSVYSVKQKRSSLEKLVPRVDVRGEPRDEPDLHPRKDQQPDDAFRVVDEKHMLQTGESLLSQICNAVNPVLLTTVLFLVSICVLGVLYFMALGTTVTESEAPSPLQLQICATDVTRSSSSSAGHRCTTVKVRDEADVDRLVTDYISIHGLQLVRGDEMQADLERETTRNEEAEETIQIDIMKHVQYLRDKIDLALGWRGKESVEENDKLVELEDAPLPTAP